MVRYRLDTSGTTCHEIRSKVGHTWSPEVVTSSVRPEVNVAQSREDSSSSSLPGGAVAAIVICVLLVVVGIIVVVRHRFDFQVSFPCEADVSSALSHAVVLLRLIDCMYVLSHKLIHALLDYSCSTMLV